MVNDVFYSELHIVTNDTVQILDARTSDAVALAVRSGSPILIKSEVLDIVGSVVENQSTKTVTEEASVNAESMSKDDLDILTLEDLKELLEMSVHEEKYELAVTIRDAIKRKENNEL
jgi:bifunctional DNase/RNase